MKHLGIAAGLLLMLGSAGCATPHLTVNVKAPPGTNQGRPLYMVIRSVVTKTYLSEGYGDVAAKVITPDESVLQTAVVYPSRLTRVRVKLPPEKAVAVSFLFTTPNGAWQALLDTPVPDSIDIELQESRIRTDIPLPLSVPDMPAAPALPAAPAAPAAPAPPAAPKLAAPK
ncbi:hypothetical protein DRW03_28690 [Corallococcus sp. H22C18031201]|uniref:hypothetical protein n=1 Tax=Citreicoccus inhibens TaxID=2849499 RepID=UPI000E71D4A4|nr:hypothetical protein [Citreicoccus inhibens]MBU8899474.1 hypothetical protein [Citreicoccus inhibens]RJS17045.1 hypothetical protein DRW03_28690 [Corallococcus sp. H22C18031201]